MTPKQIELVENSWDAVLLNTKDAGMIFYSRLFDIAPELKPLFKESPEAQAQKLVSLITFAVHKLNTLDEIVNDVKSLGKRHKKYNVKPEHYGVVAEALLWTLEKALQEKWNKEMKDAWVTVYTILSSTMIAAAQEA
ncbi:MAG TPA: globin family protein [Cyclobacteriaceae bacterium]|nr:globin family protein [Cyclobacteriaceae bacterium]